MGKPFCLNVTLDDSKYSSPIPIIGLYIAAGTLVCVIFMICDILHGLRHRKPWIPCRFFSLNSVTLTLLAIASKLPVDLTTSMPSAQDQLSKLSGTVLICISMSFFTLSLGTQSDSERLSNLIALSIFVITVVVNICIQIVTGVIFSFILEHIITMSCMLLSLVVLWFAFNFHIPLYISSSSSIADELKIFDPQNSESESMMHRMKSFYPSSYRHDPELKLLSSPVCFIMCMLSTICTIVLSEAALQSLVLKKVEFRCEVSDYKWSMWMVVVSQFLIVLVGSIANVLRWLLSVKGFDSFLFGEENFYDDYFVPPSWVLSTLHKFHILYSWVLSTLSNLHIMSFFNISVMGGFMFIFQTLTRYVDMVLRILIMILMVFTKILTLMFKIPSMCLMKTTKFCYGRGRNNEDRNRMNMNQWIQRNYEKEVNRWMEKYERDSRPTHLIQLLFKTAPSQESITHKISTSSNDDKSVSFLLVVLFIRVITIALPDILSASLIHTLDEVFEIIYFIEKKRNFTDDFDRKRLALAKELWIFRDNNCHWFNTKFIKPWVKKSMDAGFQSQSDLSCALGIIEELKEICKRTSFLTFDEVIYAAREINIIYGLIMGQRSHGRTYASMNELYGQIEQLFVDMLHFFLSQLPLALFKHLVECPIMQCEERSRLSLKFLCKLEPLEEKVHWAFPEGIGITSLITPQGHPSLTDGTVITQVPVIHTQRIEPVEGTVDADVARRVIEIQELV